MKKNFLLKSFVLLVLLGASLSIHAQSNGLIYKKVIAGNNLWFKTLPDASGYALTYGSGFLIDSLDIGVWQNHPVSLTIDSLQYHGCVVLYNSNLEPTGKVLSNSYRWNPYPLTNTEVILNYHHFYSFQGLYLTTLPPASNFQGNQYGVGNYFRYNATTQSVTGLLNYSLPTPPVYYNIYPYIGFFSAINGSAQPLSAGSDVANFSAVLNDNVLIGYYQLIGQQSVNDSLDFTAWGGQVNLLRIKMNLNSGEFEATQIGSSTGSLVPLYAQPIDNGEGLYYAGLVRGNNTPVSVSGAEIEMALNDSLYHVYITKESAAGATEWLTELYAYNNTFADSIHASFNMRNTIYTILEKDENLFVNNSFNGFIPNDDTLMYRDFTGENMLLTDAIPYYGAFNNVQIPIAESSIYKLNSNGSLIGKLSYSQTIVGYNFSGQTGWLDRANRLFEVGDKLAWVHNYYSPTNTSIEFTYKTLNGSIQNSSIDLPAGKGTFILWLDTDLTIIDYWLFPYTSDDIAGVNNFNYIGQYSSDTLLIQGNLSPLSSININPFGTDLIVETTESTIVKTYFAFYSAPEILTNTPKIEELPNLSVFPNPTEGELHISGIANENSRYQIFDISGRMVQAGMLNGELFVNTSHLTSGMYILRIDTEKSSGSRKFVVK